MAGNKKLVRDKIPDKIKGKGEPCSSYIADDDEYWECLKAKLLEEAQEAVQAENPVKMAEEIADILEVIEAMLIFKKVPYSYAIQLKEEKVKERGKFSKKVILESN
jgi:predicted house-cleaning noncanonical NTP pyrophosphatase (MazG superfamily)